MRWEFSHLPQPLSITSLSLTRSLSTESKLDVLQGCWCNVFMTSRLCVDVVVADVNKSNKEVEGWNMPFHWGRGVVDLIFWGGNEEGFIWEGGGTVRREKCCTTEEWKMKCTETVSMRRLTYNNKPQHKNNNRVVAKPALKYRTLWSYGKQLCLLQEFRVIFLKNMIQRICFTFELLHKCRRRDVLWCGLCPSVHLARTVYTFNNTTFKVKAIYQGQMLL